MGSTWKGLQIASQVFASMGAIAKKAANLFGDKLISGKPTEEKQLLSIGGAALGILGDMFNAISDYFIKD